MGNYVRYLDGSGNLIDEVKFMDYLTPADVADEVAEYMYYTKVPHLVAKVEIGSDDTDRYIEPMVQPIELFQKKMEEYAALQSRIYEINLPLGNKEIELLQEAVIRLKDKAREAMRESETEDDVTEDPYYVLDALEDKLKRAIKEAKEPKTAKL